MYKTILIASDLSEDSDQVLKRAKEIAEDHKANLHLIHVVEYTPLLYGGGEFAMPLDLNLEDTLEEQAKHSLKAQGKKFQIPENQQYVKIGTTKPEIVHMAEDIKADLIVIGSHSHHGLALLLGSTAKATVGSAPCDVLAVKVKE